MLSCKVDLLSKTDFGIIDQNDQCDLSHYKSVSRSHWQSCVQLGVCHSCLLARCEAIGEWFPEGNRPGRRQLRAVDEHAMATCPMSAPEMWTISSKLRMSKQIKKRSRRERKGILEEEKETNSSESSHTTGVGSLGAGKGAEGDKTLPQVREVSSTPPWGKTVKIRFCTQYRPGLDNTLSKPAVWDPWSHFQVSHVLVLALAKQTAPLGSLGDGRRGAVPPAVGETCLKKGHSGPLSALLTLPVAQRAQRGRGGGVRRVSNHQECCVRKNTADFQQLKLVLTSDVFHAEALRGADIQSGRD